MRNLTALLFLLPLCSLYLVFSAPASMDHKSRCCFSIIKAPIPLKHIVSYWETREDCPTNAKPAIVFQTVNKVQNVNRTVCADPQARWIHNHMRAVDLKNKATSTTKP